MKNVSQVVFQGTSTLMLSGILQLSYAILKKNSITFSFVILFPSIMSIFLIIIIMIHSWFGDSLVCLFVLYMRAGDMFTLFLQCFA